MRLRSLESRIVLLFLVLIFAVQLAAFLAIRTGIETNARAAIRTELAIGEKVFGRLLDQYAQQLTQGARLLAADYGFKEAISSNDRETIVSALSNNKNRIGASFAVLIGPDREIRASTLPSEPKDLRDEVLALVDNAERNGSAYAAGVIDRTPYQIVMVPVKAPVTIGWVAMAFLIDERLADDMQELSSLEVSIFSKDHGSDWATAASTLRPAAAQALARQLNGTTLEQRFFPQLVVDDNEYGARLKILAQDKEEIAVVVFQRSINDAVAPYRRLQLTMLVLTAVGIVVAALGSIFMAKRITGPLRALGETARRLGAGDYAGQIAMKRDDEIGDLSTAFARMRDDIAKREVEIRRLAYWDVLTDLPNRAQFASLLTESIAQAARLGDSVHVLMMDLDRFKNVNDVMGHSFGDALLRKVAERLQGQVTGHANRIARLGGDEFAILLPRTTLDEARRIAAVILKSLELPISLEDQNVDLGAGIGIAGFPQHGADAEALLSRAEVAMYEAKDNGNEAVVYNPAIDRRSQQNLSLLSELRRAAEQNEFRLYAQPKVALDTGRVIGLETLVRWAHPEKGMIYPDSFIPFAEKSGFIRTLTAWMLEHAALLCSQLLAEGITLRFSVNISTRDLLDQDLPGKFGEILTRHRIPRSSFCLEITESAIMNDPVRALQTLEGLHAMGVELSIDDFGTGYSSLAYLKRLPVDELKIDRSFVMKMESDADDVKIVQSTIDLGHTMGLKVVAEGLETEAAWRMLHDMGCDEGQGYFISRPIPAEQLRAWLESWQPPQLIRSAAAQTSLAGGVDG